MNKKVVANEHSGRQEEAQIVRTRRNKKTMIGGVTVGILQSYKSFCSSSFMIIIIIIIFFFFTTRGCFAGSW
jgi:hypothetical protein